jgi:non-ribosomal peptide synthetase component F
MLKYVTPQLYASAPRLIRRMDADIFICAQDWDNGWEKNFTASTPQIKNNTATATVILPSGETDRIRINLTLLKTASGWRINKVACANQ